MFLSLNYNTALLYAMVPKRSTTKKVLSKLMFLKEKKEAIGQPSAPPVSGEAAEATVAAEPQTIELGDEPPDSSSTPQQSSATRSISNEANPANSDLTEERK